MHRSIARLVIASLIILPSSVAVLAGTAHAATGSPGAGAAPALTTGQQSDGRPDFAYSGGSEYIAWTGTNSARNVNVATANGGSIGPVNTLGDTAIGGTGPALGAEDLGSEGPQIFVAWASTNSAHNISIGHYTGTRTLGCHTTLPEATTTSPFLVNTGFDGTGLLFLLWTGTDSAHHLNIAQVNVGSCTSSSGRVTLSPTVTLTDTADAGPAAAYLNHILYVYWPGTDSGHHISAGKYTGSNVLAQHTQTVEASTDSLGATYNNSTGTNYLTYRGTNGDVNVAYTSTTDGTHIAHNETDGSNTTPYGVGDGSDGSSVWGAWTGFDSSSTLNVDCLFC